MLMHQQMLQQKQQVYGLQGMSQAENKRLISSQEEVMNPLSQNKQDQIHQTNMINSMATQGHQP
jgi:predicted RNase H-like nuclease